jgi:DNA-binding transcriptional LysR family regulator
VSLTQIQSFVAVAEEGHVGRAARRLHLTQPPLSRQILALEDELGARLFERTPRGMRLLPAGEAFLLHARRILAEVEAALEAVHGSGAQPPEGVPEPAGGAGPRKA